MKFTVKKTSKKSLARLGSLKTDHGSIDTPFFMPIATKGAVKNLSIEEIGMVNASIILSNTYHQYLTPGTEILKKAGGLHRFMGWSGPLLTDSGGFQVFSLAKIRKISERGVEFSSHLDGSKHLFTPEKSIEIQMKIGADIMMALDECPPGGCSMKYARESLELTSRWAQRCKTYFDKHAPLYGYSQALFGIVQGGRFHSLRKRSVADLEALNFDGYAIGGVSVGESRALVRNIVEFTAPLLPLHKPRYLMGIGKPEEIVMAVKAGIDMFDCVIPTREARHGRLYYFCSRRARGAISLFGTYAYKTLLVTNAQYKKDFSAINSQSRLSLLQTHGKAYLRHLLKTGEPLGQRLATLNNVEFYITLMETTRMAVNDGEL